MTNKYNPLKSRIKSYDDTLRVSTRIESFEHWFIDNYTENSRLFKINKRIEPAAIVDDPVFPSLLAISLRNIKRELDPGVKNKAVQLFEDYLENIEPGLIGVSYSNPDALEFDLNMHGLYFRTYSIVEQACCYFEVPTLVLTKEDQVKKFEFLSISGNGLFYVDKYVQYKDGGFKKSTRKDSGFTGHEHIDLGIPILNFTKSYEIACAINDFLMNPAVSVRHVKESLSNPKILQKFVEYLNDTDKLAKLAIKLSETSCDLKELVDLVNVTGTTELKDMVNMATCLSQSESLEKVLSIGASVNGLF